MADGIFLLQDGRKLAGLVEATFETEDFLQALLVDNVDLLPGDQIDLDSPRRWLLIRREMGVPSEDGACARWSVDHLFIDQDAIPTFVEVKRSSDTRIRREVVGQMFEYAANAVKLWPAGELRRVFESGCMLTAIHPEERLKTALGDEISAEEFWKKADTNLLEGNIRMLFVADVISLELRRIVEFINKHMVPTEVLAVEIKHYTDPARNIRALVPRVYGHSIESQDRKTRETRQWDEATFLTDMQERRGPEAVSTAKLLLQWAKDQGSRLKWGNGRVYGSCHFMLDDERGPHYLFSVATEGSVGIAFGSMKNAAAPFDDQGKRRQLLQRLNEAMGTGFAEEKADLWPNIRIDLLGDVAARKRFLTMMDWVVEQIRA